jgi:hypothetical protein
MSEAGVTNNLAPLLARLLIVLQIRDVLVQQEIAAIVHGNEGIVIGPDGLTNAIAAKLRR